MKKLDEIARRMVLSPKSYEEIFESATRRARRVGKRIPRSGDRLGAIRKIEAERVAAANSYVVDRLKKIALTTPFVKELHPFYRELVLLLIDEREFKVSLSRIYGAARILDRIARECIRGVKRAADAREAAKFRRAYFGRLKSILEELDEDFKIVRDAQLRIKRLPDIDPEIASIVVAGPPNVGKSSLVRAISTAEPEVREYPFTTKSISVGHVEVGGSVVQVLDTPGLLDRPLSERNRIELQAILALKYLAGVIVFLLDPTETCGFPLDYQIRVLREIRESFEEVPMVHVSNKVDITTRGQAARLLEMLPEEVRGDLIFASATRGTNVDLVLRAALEAMGLAG